MFCHSMNIMSCYVVSHYIDLYYTILRAANFSAKTLPAKIFQGSC